MDDSFESGKSYESGRQADPQWKKKEARMGNRKKLKSFPRRDTREDSKIL